MPPLRRLNVSDADAVKALQPFLQQPQFRLAQQRQQLDVQLVESEALQRGMAWLQTSAVSRPWLLAWLEKQALLLQHQHALLLQHSQTVDGQLTQLWLLCWPAALQGWVLQGLKGVHQGYHGLGWLGQQGARAWLLLQTLPSFKPLREESAWPLGVSVAIMQHLLGSLQEQADREESLQVKQALAQWQHQLFSVQTYSDALGKGLLFHQPNKMPQMPTSPPLSNRQPPSPPPRLVVHPLEKPLL